MTIENSVYGVSWVCCARCTVRQPLASLHFVGLDWICKDTPRCQRYIAEVVTPEIREAAKKDPALFK